MALIPGAFIQTADVTFDGVNDIVLQIGSTAGFAALDYGVLPANSSTPTGLVGATTYTASVNVDNGTIRAISILGSTAQTFTTLLAELNTDLAAGGAAATAALVGGQIVITSATTGVASSVVVTDTDLFRSVKGTNFGLASNRSTRGSASYVRWNALPEDVALEWEAKAAILSPTQTFKTFASDSITIAGTGIVPASPMTIAANTYDLTVTVNGVNKSVAVAVGAAETFATFAPKFEAALKVQWPQLTSSLVATTNLLTLNVTTNVPGNIATAAPTVTAGTVVDLIGALTAILAPIDFTAAVAAAVAGTEGTVGNSNTPALYAAALTSTKALAGVPMMQIIPTKAFFRRVNKPAARGDAREVSVYYNGSAWVDWTTDLAIA
jgi:hypothetical protein